MTSRRFKKSETFRPGSGVNVFMEKLMGRRIEGEPAPDLDELAPDDLKQARAILQSFTREHARARRQARCRNFDDPMEVAALELRGATAKDPRASPHCGAWFSRVKARGEGHAAPWRPGFVMPLHGPGEGLHALVLDARALAELLAALSEHHAQAGDYDQLRADLAQLRRMRGAA